MTISSYVYAFWKIQWTNYMFLILTNRKNKNDSVVGELQVRLRCCKYHSPNHFNLGEHLAFISSEYKTFFTMAKILFLGHGENVM